MLGIQFGLLQYRSIFVSRVSDRDRNFLSPAGFVSHCCDSLLRQGNICPPQMSLAVVLLRLFVPRLIFLVKNRNERLKSLNILACVQIGMWIKFQSELCIFFSCVRKSQVSWYLYIGSKRKTSPEIKDILRTLTIISGISYYTPEQ